MLDDTRTFDHLPALDVLTAKLDILLHFGSAAARAPRREMRPVLAAHRSSMVGTLGAPHFGFGAGFLARLLALGTLGLPVVVTVAGVAGGECRRRSADEKSEEK